MRGRSWLVAVFALALATRLVWVATLGPDLMWPDEEEFVRIAHRLAAGEGYVSASYRANPVLPTYLAAVFHVAGESHAAARVGQALMGALTCVVVAATATRLLGARVGLVAGLLLALYAPHVYLSGVFYAECLFTLLIALTVHCAVRTIAEPRVRWALATGLCFAAAALTRPIVLAYLPVLVAVFVYALPLPRPRRVAIAAGLVLATALAILPWTLRNVLVLGRPVVVSSGFGTKLWQGNNEGAAADADDRELTFDQDVWRARVASLPPGERAAVEARYAEAAERIAALRVATGDPYLAQDAVLGPLAVEFILTHPLRAAELFVRKLGILLLPFSKTLVVNADTTPLKRAVAAAFYVPVLVLAPLGFWWTIGRAPGLAVVYGLIASLAATYAALTTCTRFRLPLDPYLIVFAAAALVELRARRELAARADRPLEERPILLADAALPTAALHHQPLADHARAPRLETEP